MPSGYSKIREDNIREYGEGSRHLAFLGRLYTDRTHFIFELLQNAEDAGAAKISFKLFDARLEVTHDGRPFNESDVRGLCGVGESTKTEDLTQIGKFGIGFKSVYADLPPCIASGLKFGSVSEREETDDEAEPVYGSTAHRDAARASGRDVCGRSVPQARDLGCDI